MASELEKLGELQRKLFEKEYTNFGNNIAGGLKMKKESKVIPWGHSNGVILTKEILQEAGLVAGSKVKVATEKRNGHVVIILDPIKKESLAEKYAYYQGVPESYEYPADLKNWENAKPFGKELL